jgi:hypothetical protein
MYAVKAYGGVEIYLQSFLTSALGTGERLNSCPCRLTQETEPRRLGGPQSRSGRFGEESLAPAGIRTPNHSARNLITIPTMLSRNIY